MFRGTACVVAALLGVAGGLLDAGVAPPAAAQETALAPLGDDQRAVLEDVPNQDTPPTERFYFRSNEWRQDLLRPHLMGLRGAYVGVGSDQNYTMAAMAQSEVLYLVDFDARIRAVHRIYGALLEDAETPDELIARFDPADTADTREILDRRLADDPDRAMALEIFDRVRAPWHAYLERVQGTQWEERPVTWLGDRALYDHVRALFRSGRVVARTGDVTSPDVLQAVARSVTRLGVPVRVVYFSNAEQFFPYTDPFIANMHALPTDERTVLVRTIRHRRIPKAPRGRWHYMVHHFPDFLERLDTGAYHRSFALVGDLLAAGPPFLGADGVSTMTRDTPRRALERARASR